MWTKSFISSAVLYLHLWWFFFLLMLSLFLHRYNVFPPYTFSFPPQTLSSSPSLSQYAMIACGGEKLLWTEFSQIFFSAPNLFKLNQTKGLRFAIDHSNLFCSVGWIMRVPDWWFSPGEPFWFPWLVIFFRTTFLIGGRGSAMEPCAIATTGLHFPNISNVPTQLTRF